MKEATGEANMTIITIVLISMVAGMVGLIIVNSMNNTSDKTQCENCGGFYENGSCHVTEGSTDTITDYENCE